MTPSRDVGAEEVRELFRAAYDGEPFIELADEPPGVREVRDTNICRIHATVEPATGRVLAFAAPLKGPPVKIIPVKAVFHVTGRDVVRPPEKCCRVRRHILWTRTINDLDVVSPAR